MPVTVLSTIHMLTHVILMMTPGHGEVVPWSQRRVHIQTWLVCLLKLLSYPRCWRVSGVAEGTGRACHSKRWWVGLSFSWGAAMWDCAVAPGPHWEGHTGHLPPGELDKAPGHICRAKSPPAHPINTKHADDKSHCHSWLPLLWKYTWEPWGLIGLFLLLAWSSWKNTGPEGSATF